MEGSNKHGYGTYTWADGSIYVGEYKNDKYHGNGTYTYANGNKYIGEWKNDKKDGNGTYTGANGDTYVGEYKNGKNDGNGTYTYANGDKYVGQMKDGNFNGQGTYTLADGTIEHSGEWVNDEPKKELALLKESLANHVDEEEESDMIARVEAALVGAEFPPDQVAQSLKRVRLEYGDSIDDDQANKMAIFKLVYPKKSRAEYRIEATRKLSKATLKGEFDESIEAWMQRHRE